MPSDHLGDFPHADVVTLASKRAGGDAALALAVGVGRSAISNWRREGIPVARVPAIARVTGLQLHELRPDVFDAPSFVTEHA
jgi:DNA-binding transcriptional regulator YdaS (Cro superfamily)